MKIQYLGKTRSNLEHGNWYEVNYSITPFYVWFRVGDVELTYHDIFEAALEWNIKNEAKLADYFAVMRKLP